MYSNNTVLFNQIQHPERGESIRTIGQKSEVINKVNKEVIVSTEQMHLQNRPESVLRLYNELKENIFAISSDITLIPKRVYIAFIRKTILLM